MSLGKFSYCLKALLGKGLGKAENFIESNNKRDYLYKLTPAGLSEKPAVAMRFLSHKMCEYEKIRHEIVRLKNEIDLGYVGKGYWFWPFSYKPEMQKFDEVLPI